MCRLKPGPRNGHLALYLLFELVFPSSKLVGDSRRPLEVSHCHRHWRKNDSFVLTPVRVLPLKQRVVPARDTWPCETGLDLRQAGNHSRHGGCAPTYPPSSAIKKPRCRTTLVVAPPITALVTEHTRGNCESSDWSNTTCKALPV